MATRILMGLVTAILVALAPGGALAQSAPVRVTTNVDLGARLKEIERDPRQLEVHLKNGRKVAAFCANCHGDGGNSVKPEIPNLAGQNTGYLLEQVRRFADGRRRNEFMEGLIKAMSADEKIGVAVFFASQEVLSKPVTDPALAAQGKGYYDKICFRCHGEQGRGNETFARIAGQQTDYLTQTLKRYRDGNGVRMDPLMAANTKTMTDADIRAVVAYVSTMK